MSRKQKGNTLIEVLFSIFLAGLCATVLAVSMPIANRSRERANHQNIATSLAQKQMEALRSLGYPSLTAALLESNGLIDSRTPIATNTFSFTNVDQGNADSPALALPSGTGRLILRQQGLDLRSITLEVRWVENGRARSVEVSTLVANL